VGFVGWSRVRSRPAPDFESEGRRFDPCQAHHCFKRSLCPHCIACPEVEVRGDEVRIGETGNLAVLK
jgi:hypothetical protein